MRHRIYWLGLEWFNFGNDTHHLTIICGVPNLPKKWFKFTATSQSQPCPFEAHMVMEIRETKNAKKSIHLHVHFTCQ